MRDSSLVHAVRVLYLAVDVVFALYLVLLPDHEFQRNPVWHEAFRLVPGHSSLVLGLAFLVGPALAGLAAIMPHGHRWARVSYDVAVLGLGLAGACWALLAVSYGFAAYFLHGIGLGGAALALAAGMVHGLMAFQFRRT